MPVEIASQMAVVDWSMLLAVGLGLIAMAARGSPKQRIIVVGSLLARRGSGAAAAGWNACWLPDLLLLLLLLLVVKIN